MKGNNIHSDEKSKKVDLNIWLSDEMKEKLESKAAQKNIDVVDLIMEYLETGLKKRSRCEKKKVRVLVESQQTMNKIIESLEPEQEEIKQELIDYTEGVKNLWERS